MKVVELKILHIRYIMLSVSSGVLDIVEKILYLHCSLKFSPSMMKMPKPVL